AEYLSGQPRERGVEPVDERHDDHDEDQHDTGELEKFLAGRGDDLAEFSDDLTEEQRDPAEEAELLLTGGAACRDDLAALFVLIHPEYTYRVQAWADAHGGQE